MRFRLVRRTIAHARGASILVSLLVLAVTGMLVTAPVAFNRMVAGEFEQTLAEAAPTERHLIATSLTAPEPGPLRSPESSDLDVDLRPTYGALDEQLASIRATFDEPLRTTIGTPRWSITTGSLDLGVAKDGSDPRLAEQLIRLRVDPRADEQVTLVDGAWPLHETEPAPEAPVGVVVSEETAQRMAWAVGEERSGFLLTGVFRPRDADADYWALNESMVEPFVFADGNSRASITATAFADPYRYPDAFADQGSVKVWYPLDLTATPGHALGDVLAQLRAVTARTYTRPDGGSGGMGTVRLEAAGIAPLDGALGQTDAARAVGMLAATGPVGSALVVLVLAVRALAGRRRHAVGLLAGRGASRTLLRSMLVVDGVLCGVLPAIGVALLGRAIFGADLPVPGMAVAASVGLVPLVLLATTRIEPSVRPTRADTGVRSRSQYRWVVEALLLSAAAASVYLLVVNGITGDGEVDLLVVTAPVLLAGSACVAVLRLYPLPLRALARWLARGRSTIGFLGCTRALRDPAVGAAPVLAVVAGIAIAVFSAVVVSTLDGGAEDTALVEVGANLRYDGSFVSAEQLSTIREIEGVTGASRIQQLAPRSIAIPGRTPEPTQVYLADLDQLARVQADVPGGFRELEVPAASVVTSRDVAATTVTDGDGPMPVTGAADRIPGITDDGGRWILADSSSARFGTFTPTSVLIGLSDSADRELVAGAVVDALGGNGVLSDAAVVEDGLRDDSIASGLRTALLAALVAAGLAAAATVVLTLVVGASSRTRMLAILRAMGVTRRQRRWLVVWEQAPVASGALVVGAGLGLGLALLVHEVVDLTAFAGGGLQPPLTVRWLQLFSLVGGFMVVLAAAVGVGVLATRRTSAATAVRLDEE